uniref:Uncharacterized protein n=1 Tax=Glossina morsitans morsitans TaxID=37546 RepID=A0A1B0FMY8_GLOMM
MCGHLQSQTPCVWRLFHHTGHAQFNLLSYTRNIRSNTLKMYKLFAFALFAIVASVIAKPGVVAPVAYTAPVVAAAPLAASTVVSRQYHGAFAAPYVAAAPYAAPYLAAPYTAAALASPYAAPYVAAPYAATPYAAAAPYVAAPYTAAYTAPVLLKNKLPLISNVY